MEKGTSDTKARKFVGPYRLASTRRDDVILDPFFGTGTTGAVAKKLSQQFIGIEQDATYVNIARRRIAEVTPVGQNIFSRPNRVGPCQNPIWQLAGAWFAKPW